MKLKGCDIKHYKVNGSFNRNPQNAYEEQEIGKGIRTLNRMKAAS